MRGALGFFDPQTCELQKRFATDLLTHVNPYTGRAYIEEPSLAFVEINNENGLVQAFLSADLDDLPTHYAGLLAGSVEQLASEQLRQPRRARSRVGRATGRTRR